MGIYVGTYKNPLTGDAINDAVIQASAVAGKVIVSTLSETSFTHYGRMPFVDYPWD